MLRKFAAFPEIQVIDLDAAIGTGANDDLVEWIAAQSRIRVGGGVRTPEKARRLVEHGVEQGDRRHGRIRTEAARMRISSKI